MKNNPYYKNERGFTLLELVVVTSILGIVAVVIVNLIHGQAKTFSRVFNDSELLTNGKRAMYLLRKDLHEISPGNITTMTSSSLIFTNSSNETIEYSKTSNKITRNGTVLAKYVTTNPFNYLDADQNTTGTINDLVFIRVNLQLGKLEESLQFDELIYLRN